MKIQKVVSLVLISTFSAQAFAIDYKPFSTIDPSIEQRADIRKKIPKLRVALPAKGESAFSLITLSDVRLSLFNEVAAILTVATKPGPYVSIDMKSDAQECATHEEIAREAKPVPKSQPGCNSVAQAFAQAFQPGFEKSCRYVHQPLRYVEDQRPGVLVHENMQNLEGLIALAGEAITHIRFPDNLIGRETLSRFSEIVAKIRTPKMNLALQANQTRLTGLKNALAAGQKCVSNPVELGKSIDLLLAETKVASVRLAELDSKGRTRAAADRLKIVNAGRTRETLPYPSLSDSDRELVSFFIGGIYWRMRGGGLVDAPQGTQETRLVYHKYPSEVIGELNGGAIGKSAGSAFFPRVFQGWGDWMDMGRTTKDQDRFYDLTYMTDRGLYHVEGAAQILSRAGFETSNLIAGGMQMGPVYYFGWDQLMNVKIGEEQKLPYNWFLEGPWAWGEFATGAAINIGLSKTLLAGKK